MDYAARLLGGRRSQDRLHVQFPLAELRQVDILVQASPKYRSKKAASLSSTVCFLAA